MSARPPAIRLATGEHLVDYATAARFLGTTKNGLKANWLRAGWLKPAPYTQGRRRFLLAADVERAKAARARVATSRRLLTAGEAAAYLGIGSRQVQRHVAAGHLREAMPSTDLFSTFDLDRVLLLRAGIHDPISKAEAARLAGVSKATFDYWVEVGRVDAHRVGRFVYTSRAAVLAIARDRNRAKAKIRRDVVEGRLLRTPDAARRLGVSEVALFKAFEKGILAPVHVASLRRTFVRAADVEHVRRAGLIKGPRRNGLPAGVLDVAAAAKLLGIYRRTVRDLVIGGKLRVAARGNHGARAAFGFEPNDVFALKAEQERTARRAMLVTARDACRILGVDADDLRVLVHDGVVPVAARDSNRFFFDVAALRRARNTPAVARRRERIVAPRARKRARRGPAAR